MVKLTKYKLSGRSECNARISFFIWMLAGLTMLKWSLKDHLDKPVFEPLKDPEYFKSFQLGSWTVSWDNGADFAPEFLYHLVTRQALVT